MSKKFDWMENQFKDLVAVVRFPRDEGFAAYPVTIAVDQNQDEASDPIWLLRESVDAFIAASHIPKIRALVGQQFYLRFADAREALPDEVLGGWVARLQLVGMELVLGEPPAPHVRVQRESVHCPCGVWLNFGVQVRGDEVLAFRKELVTGGNVQELPPADLDLYLNEARQLAYCSGECRVRFGVASLTV
jgi:hypothetical protein